MAALRCSLRYWGVYLQKNNKKAEPKGSAFLLILFSA